MSDFIQRRTTMVDTQVRPSDVTKYPIIEAMLAVPREAFLPDDLRDLAYVGEDLELAPGRVVLDPRGFAKMLDAVDIQPDELVLDIGCGLGYSAAVLARLAEFVVALEEDEAMSGEAQSLLSSHGIDNVAVIAGPLAAGAAKHGPYDVIVIEGGVETVPAGLTDQLKDGGRIAAIFRDGKLGALRIGFRQDGAIDWRDEFNLSAPVLPGFEAPHAFAF